ncbi:MAG: hypothetical protein KF778_12295 [Rhodocyclaceae bacterium]|nr:hypothetical protein [Rhodocyclaceae bacterium]MBX3669179.1 hypothetical protein [Rhodocyclaceae bacterium]
MTNDIPSAAAQSAQSLYGWWLGAIPRLFAGFTPANPLAAFMPPASAAPDVAEQKPASPFPVGQMVQALASAQQTLAPIYQAYAQALAGNMPQLPGLGALPMGAEAQAQQFSEVLGKFGQMFSAPLALPDGAVNSWNNFLKHDSDVLGSLMSGAERTFGAVADALGLAPSRDLREAWQTMEAAALAKQQAQAEYLGVMARIWAKGLDGLRAHLTEMGGRGESVESVSALIRLWAKVADAAAHDAMQSEDGLQASAKMIRASTRYRQAAHRVVGIMSEAMNVPTRAEVDAAYREIQELKRELRRLRKSGAAPIASKRSVTQRKDGKA